MANVEQVGPSGPYYVTPGQRKRRAIEEAKSTVARKKAEIESTTNVIVKFVSKDDIHDDNSQRSTLPQVEIPLNSTTDELQKIINTLLKHDETRPYAFFVNEEEIVSSMNDTVTSQNLSTEVVVPILYQPQAIFRVRRVSRCTSSLPGHTEPILHVHFSPDGKHLASGSGDATVRLWDVDTETPRVTLRGHENWVMAVCWAPTGHLLASASMDKTIRIWNALSGKRVGKPLSGHTKYVTCLAWEPLHVRTDLQNDDQESPARSSADGAAMWDGCALRLASGGKDGIIKVWDTTMRRCRLSMGGHTMAIQSIQWGGEGLLYSASQDRTIRVWDTRGQSGGKLVRVLSGHAHWVNTLSISTSYAMRTGPFDYTHVRPVSRTQAVTLARTHYDNAMNVCKKELLVSGSDDFTLFLWSPTTTKKPINRMTGHQQPVNSVCFSPDARYIASGSFDNSVRLWNGLTGAFLAVFRGHVQSVYQVIFSPDSRMLVSSSKDSTIKVWDIRKKLLKSDLPGHADEVFAVDWSPDGERVASGGKDTLLRVWRA